MRNLFSKGLMAAAAVMMFASCSNEEGVNVPVANGDQTKVTLGVSVLGSKAAADMNFEDPTKLTNVAVVPFVGNAPQKPIQWANVTSKTEPVVAQMVNTVDHFKVYGNLTGTQYGKTADVYGLTDADFALTKAGVINGNQTYNPHEALYYFADATSFMRATEGTDWASAAYGDAEEGAINDAKYIKISGVSYAVGTLAAAVMNGDATACFYPTADLTAEDAMDATTAGVKVTGILIDGQKDLTADLATKGDAKTVYEVADKEGAFATVKIDNKDNALANGNIFSIVSPTSNGEAVNVNIEFELPQNVFLKQTNGNKVGSADSATKIYLGLKLTKNDTDYTNEVFGKGLVTILNATVKNWGIASDKPVVVTNAEIGVEFDTTWEDGNIYNVEI